MCFFICCNNQQQVIVPSVPSAPAKPVSTVATRIDAVAKKLPAQQAPQLQSAPPLPLQSKPHSKHPTLTSFSVTPMGLTPGSVGSISLVVTPQSANGEKIGKTVMVSGCQPPQSGYSGATVPSPFFPNIHIAVIK